MVAIRNDVGLLAEENMIPLQNASWETFLRLSRLWGS
jgi:hypothetical protein